jgi:tetratricopeptide (TPR) repeat protein
MSNLDFPKRWLEEAGTPEEARAAALLRHAKEAKASDAEALARIERALWARLGRARPRRPRWQWALVVGLGGGLAFAATWTAQALLGGARPKGDVVASTGSGSGPVAGSAALAGHQAEAPAAAEHWVDEVVGGEAAVPTKPLLLPGLSLSPSSEAGVARPTRAPARPVGDALAAESGLLGEALRALRQAQDPTLALATLDRYRRQFPRGQLRVEAEVARVDALLALGRGADAVAVLDRLERPTPELRLLRAELLAEGGRCPEALAVFERALTGGGALAERALAGRATCRALLGDGFGASNDARRYLELYPRGRRAEAMRRLTTR